MNVFERTRLKINRTKIGEISNYFAREIKIFFEMKEAIEKETDRKLFLFVYILINNLRGERNDVTFTCIKLIKSLS